MHWLWFHAVVLFVLTGAASVGKTRKSSEPSISMRSTRISLQVLCQKLTSISGQPHTVSSSVAGLHVSLSLHAIPIRVARDRVAEAMNLTWVDSGDAAASPGLSFRLIQSEKNRNLERAIADEAESAFRDSVDRMISAQRRGEAALRDLAENDEGFAFTLNQPGARDALAILSALPRSEIDRIMAGDHVRLGGPGEQQGVLAASSAYLAGTRARNPAFSQVGTTLSGLSIGRSNAGEESSLAIGVSGVGGTSTLLSLAPNKSFRSWWDTDKMRASRASVSQIVEVAARKDGMTFDALVEDLSEELGFSYVAESYMDSFNERSVRHSRSLLASVLCDAVMSDRTWWRHGSVYLFQRQRWWEDREAEIPDSVLAEIKGRVKAGLNSLDDWANLACLSEKQWPHLQGLHLREFNLEHEWLPELALYHALSAGDRRSLFAGGLRLSALNGKRREAILNWVRKRADGNAAVLNRVQDLLVSARVAGSDTEFTGTAVSADGSIVQACKRSVALLPEAEMRRRELLKTERKKDANVR